MTSFIGADSGVNSVAIPTHAVGDLILIFAFRDGAGTTPTLPAGYTSSADNSANNSSFRLGYKIATSTSETSGTWTDATAVLVQVYRPSVNATLSLGSTPNSFTDGFETIVTYPSLTLDITDGSSWVAGFVGHRANNTATNTPPTGMVNRSYFTDVINRAGGQDTNGGVAAWSSTTIDVGGSASAYHSIVVEVVETVTTGLTIDSTDSTMQRGTNFELVCSGATTAPTTANTTLTSGNDTLTPSSVTGSDPYTLTFAVGDLTKQVDATGYDWTLEITL